MTWTGVRPRKLSININFSKPTNRDGAKLIVVKEVLPQKSPRTFSMDIRVGSSKIMPEPKREKKTGIVPGPAMYSPRFEAVEAKRDKSV